MHWHSTLLSQNPTLVLNMEWGRMLGLKIFNSCYMTSSHYLSNSNLESEQNPSEIVVVMIDLNHI